MGASFYHQPEGTAVRNRGEEPQQDAKWRESQTMFRMWKSSSHFMCMDLTDVSHLIFILFAHTLN